MVPISGVFYNWFPQSLTFLRFTTYFLINGTRRSLQVRGTNSFACGERNVSRVFRELSRAPVLPRGSCRFNIWKSVVFRGVFSFTDFELNVRRVSQRFRAPIETPVETSHCCGSGGDGGGDNDVLTRESIAVFARGVKINTRRRPEWYFRFFCRIRCVFSQRQKQTKRIHVEKYTTRDVLTSRSVDGAGCDVCSRKRLFFERRRCFKWNLLLAMG